MRPRVLLCVMPFLPVERPALGVSLLKSRLAAEGMGCDVLYTNHRYLDRVSFDLYQRVAQYSPTHDLIGEWIFSRALHGAAAPDDAAFAAFAEGRPGNFYDAGFIGQIGYARKLATEFIEDVARGIDLDAYDIVGFSTTFQQNVASLALARRLKELKPGLFVVFGGANCEDEMGVELHRSFPFIDAVCSGEADDSFPALVRAVRQGAAGFDGIPGVTWRAASGESVTGSSGPRPVERMDALPYPDHAEFLEAYRRSTASLYVDPELTVETSRGCWWGQKHHCTFCGLNGNSIAYRSKSPQRAIDEIRHLRDTYDVSTFFCTDNIVDMDYFESVFPALAADGSQMQLFYETKSNLQKEQLLALRRLGTRWLQPGIESLSTPVLKLMRKGVQGIQNIQTLKWARETGFLLTWNMLCGFPGETPADYDELTRVMRLIPHLPPPSSFAMFRLDRFSPMFRKPADFGLRRIRPYPSYGLCYGLPEESLSRLAYFFTYEGAATPETLEAINRAWVVGQWWKKNHRRGSLTALLGDHFISLVDTRAGRTPGHYLLHGRHRSIYLALDGIQSLPSLLHRLERSEPEIPWREQEVASIVDEFVEQELVLKDGELYLALGILEPAEAVRDEPGEIRVPSVGALKRRPASLNV